MADRKCKWCGTTYTATGNHQLYCSKRCAYLAKLERLKHTNTGSDRIPEPPPTDETPEREICNPIYIEGKWLCSEPVCEWRDSCTGYCPGRGCMRQRAKARVIPPAPPVLLESKEFDRGD